MMDEESDVEKVSNKKVTFRFRMNDLISEMRLEGAQELPLTTF